MSARTEELIVEISAKFGVAFPPRLRCIVDKYEDCVAGDYSQCKSDRTRQIMKQIVDLASFHPRYEVEGDELPVTLLCDIGIVTMTAIAENDDCVAALEDFLDAAVKEIPATVH